MLCLSLPATALAVAALLSSFASAAPASPPTTLNPRAASRFNFGNTDVRGVNLGGWFVLEPWITPSLFEPLPASVVDEWTMSAYLGKAEMEKRMQKHWSTWIVEDDFAQIKAAGLNLVRIPIGYWSVSPVAGDPYVQGAYDFLNKALGWASDHGLAVMIDLHGAPGSQNGFDNSGHKGPINWLKGNTAAQTHTALNKIRDDHASNPVVATIELVNEPVASVLGLANVRNFYTAGYNALKSTAAWTTIHDAFEGVSTWHSWAAPKTRVLIDTHYYQVFGVATLKYTPQQHINTACQFGPQLVSNVPTICGEFTGAMTDCAKWLNGRGVGARYDGTYPGTNRIGSCSGLATGTVAGLSAAQKANIGKFGQAQMVSFEKASGWIWWTWRTEAAPEWDYQALYKAGVLPNANNLNKNACG